MFENLPIPEKDVISFNYRVGALYKTINKSKIKLFRMIELKKIMLKAKSMKVNLYSYYFLSMS